MANRPQYSDHECTGPSFFPGAARGRRSWMLDSDGWLRGVTYKAKWEPGENVARCFVTRLTNPKTGVPNILLANRNIKGRPTWVAGGFGFEGQTELVLPGYTADPCDGLAADCACGFYAYHTGRTSYGVAGASGMRVDGVVEGYGKVILGTAGYRAQKARILAVVLPAPSDAAKHRDSVLRTIRDLEAQLQENRPWVSNATLTYALSSLMALAFYPVAAHAAALVAGALATMAVFTERYARDAWRQVRVDLVKALVDLKAEYAKLPHDFTPAIMACRKNYPDVQFFDSMDELEATYTVESLKYLAENDGRGTE